MKEQRINMQTTIRNNRTTKVQILAVLKFIELREEAAKVKGDHQTAFECACIREEMCETYGVN